MTIRFPYLHEALSAAIASAEAGEPVDLSISITNDSVSVTGYKPDRAPPAKVEEAVMEEVAAMATSSTSNTDAGLDVRMFAGSETISTRGFRVGDKLLDQLNDRCEVVEVLNGHAVVVFEGPGGGRKIVLIGSVQDKFRKEPAPCRTDAADPAPMIERHGFRYQLGSHVVLETSRSAYDQRVKDEQENPDFETFHERAGALPIATLRSFTGPIEEGEVIARLEYATGVRSYLVRYRGGDGRQVEAYWDEDALYQPDPDFDEVPPAA